MLKNVYTNITLNINRCHVKYILMNRDVEEDTRLATNFNFTFKTRLSLNFVYEKNIENE